MNVTRMIIATAHIETRFPFVRVTVLSHEWKERPCTHMFPKVRFPPPLRASHCPKYALCLPISSGDYAQGSWGHPS